MKFSPWLEVAVRAAREAGHVLMDRFVRPPEPGDVSYKGHVNPVTEADHAAEACIVSLLREAFPDHGIVAEEGSRHGSDARLRWYVDPLDGTTNFAHRLPWFGVSLALTDGDDVLAGVVYHPALDELFVAERGRGAWAVRGEVVDRLRVSTTGSLRHALVGTGTPADIGITGNNLSQIVAMLKVTEDVRQMGSAAINLCSVAAGRLDAFWEPDLNPWDVAAGALMVLEARGTVTGMDGSPYVAHTRSPLATNGLLHRQMLALLAAGDRQCQG